MPEDTATEAQTDTGIEPDRAAELVAAGAALIDVRRDYEWEAGRIPGATHIEVNEVAGKAESISRESPVIFYCRTGSRSSIAAAAFRQAGWKAYNLEGGLTAWVEGGHEIEPEDGEVAQPRPGS